MQTIVARHHPSHHQQVRLPARRQTIRLLWAYILAGYKQTLVVAGQMHPQFRQICPAHQVDPAVGHPKDRYPHQVIEVPQQGLHSTTTEGSATQTHCERSTVC